MTLKRMDNVGIVVDNLEATIDFFLELGLELEGRFMVEGEWAGRVTGLGDQRVEIAMMRTPDGHSRLELSRFLVPPVVADHRNAPVNALGYLRVMFAVDDIDETLARLRKHGAQLVSSEVVQYEDSYRLCHIRGPEGLLIGLAETSAEQHQNERPRLNRHHATPRCRPARRERTRSRVGDRRVRFVSDHGDDCDQRRRRLSKQTACFRGSDYRLPPRDHPPSRICELGVAGLSGPECSSSLGGATCVAAPWQQTDIEPCYSGLRTQFEIRMSMRVLLSLWY